MIRQTKDGRKILTGADYAALRRDKWEEQGGICADCSRPIKLEAMHLHHLNGRGLGGSKRDDTGEATKGLCPSCHIGPSGRHHR